MTETAPALESEGFRRAYVENERKVRIQTGKLACALAFFLMPLGSWADTWQFADLFTQQPHLRFFFMGLRFLCSLLIVGIWLLHHTPIARGFYPLVGMPLVLLPALCMIIIMGMTDDRAASPYYAALNCILLAVSAVGRWSVGETLFAAGSVILMYVGLYELKGGEPSVFKTSLYFTCLTGLITVCGNFLFNRVRFSEFAARYELDKNRRQLEETNQKLRELDEVKSRFFANISHELRTPLTLLLAPLEMLLQRFKLDAETRSTLQTMHANGMRLLKLINDLLDLVRLESGRMEIKHEPVDVADFIKGLASAARQVADDKRLRLETVVDPALGCALLDQDKLEKVVLNLVFNALKFTPAGGQVTLRAQKAESEILITVSDTGLGISQKHLPYIFDRFWQVDGTSRRKYQGAGIGLALVKELVEIQGGTVAVASEEGKGTTFSVRLPYTPSAPVVKTLPATSGSSPDGDGRTVSSEEWVINLYRRAELFPAVTPVQESLKPVETGTNGSHPTILIADDEPDMLRFLKTQLRAQYHILEAVDGQQAIEKAAQFLPDLIVLDMMMPEKDGLQACREIRESTPTRSTPIILLTARADEETKLAALSAGASDFLAKPFSTTELHVRIKNLVDSHKYQRHLTRKKQELESAIEQLKETEVELVRSAKMSSLGVVAAGLMHEINNALNFPTTNLYALRKKADQLAPELREEYLDALNETNEGITRVTRLTKELRKFAHPNADSMEQVDIPEAVASALLFTGHELEKAGVKVEQNLTEHQAVWANKNNLVQVFMNLLLNSRDALQGKKFESEMPTIWIESRVQDRKNLVVIRDNGAGIEKQHLDKIFDPFFTTKDVGAGTGLGLSICYRIVEACDGSISVRSEPGQFCEFTLAFPLKG